MSRLSLTSPVLIAVLIVGLATSSSAQTLRASAASAGTAAGMAAQGPGGDYNKPLLYTGSAMLGAGIGLVIGGIVYASDCNDYDGLGFIGELAEDECRDAAARRYLYGAVFASGGTVLMLLARPKVASAIPSISFSGGRTTVKKTIRF